ncbi:hypothetical protein BGZ51_004420 [Haplosporangium sp. Z 767]|nr:hypothetical protein BGZ51_004420 [Haplosporangium sp. Z 767]
MSHPTIESTPPPPAPSSPFISPDQASTQTESGESTVQVSFSLGGHPSGIVPYAELARQRQLHQQQQHVHEHEHWQPHAHTNTDAHTNTQALDCQRGSDTPMTDVSKATSITSTSTSTSISTPVSTSVSESTALVSAPYANGLGSQRVWTQGSFNTEDALDNNSSYNSNGGAAIDGDSGSGSRNITRLGCTSVGEEAEVHAEKPAEQHVAAAEREYQYLQNTYLHNQYRHTDMHMGQKRDQQQSYPTQIQAQVQRQGKMDRATRGDQEQADVGSVASNNKIEEKYSSSRSSYDNATVDQCRIVGPKTTVDANNAAPSATIMTQKPGTHSHGSRASSSAVSNISFEHKLRCTVPLIPSHPMTSSSTPTPTTPTLTVPKTPAPPVAEDEYSSLLDTEHSLPDSNLSPPSTSSPSPMLSTFTTALSDPDKLSKPSNATATVTTTIATTSIEPSATTPATTAESKQPSTSTMDGLEPVLHTTPQSDLTAATTAAIAAPAPSDTVPKMSRVHPAIAQPQKKPIQPQPLHENVKATFAVVADLAGKESWATKERFPPHLRGPLFECAKVALAVRTTGYMIEDHFFVHLQTILPYNKFTLKKLIYKNILPEWIRELQTQKEGLLAMFKKRVHADALALGLSTEFIQRSENNVSDDSRKTLTWTPGLRLLLWEIVEKYMEIRAANKELHLIDSKTFPPHRPESQTKKDAYETLLQSFPAGCMTSAEISRQYSQLKEKVTSQKKATTENQDSQPVSSICSTSSANGVQRRSLSVATPTELLPLENRNHSVTAATPLESALASTNTTSYRPPSPEDSPATTPMMHLLDRRSSEMSTGRHQNLSTDEEMQQGASKFDGIARDCRSESRRGSGSCSQDPLIIPDTPTRRLEPSITAGAREIPQGSMQQLFATSDPESRRQSASDTAASSSQLLFRPPHLSAVRMPLPLSPLSPQWFSADNTTQTTKRTRDDTDASATPMRPVLLVPPSSIGVGTAPTTQAMDTSLSELPISTAISSRPVSRTSNASYSPRAATYSPALHSIGGPSKRVRCDSLNSPIGEYSFDHQLQLQQQHQQPQQLQFRMRQQQLRDPSSPRLSSQEDLHRLKLKDQQIQTQEMQPKLVIERSQQEQELWNQRMSTQTNPRDETTRLPPIPPQTPSNVQTWNERTESMRRKEREKEEKRLLEEQERRVMMQAEILLREQSRLKELREQQQERQREQAEQKLQRQKEMQLKWKQEEEERRQKEEQRQKEMEAHLSKEELWVLEQHKKEKELERQRELRQAEQRWKEEQQLEQQRRMQEQMSQWHPRSTSKVRTIKPQGGMTLSQLQAHHQDSLMDPKATNHDRLQMGSVPEHQSSHRHSIQDQPTRQSRSSYPQRMHPYQSPHPPRLDQDRNEAGTRFQPTGPNERQAEVMSPRGPSMTFIRQSLPAEQGRAPASILTQVKIAEQTLGHPQERDYRPVGYPALPPKEYKAAADEHRRYEYLHFSQHRTQQQRVQDSSDQSDGSH